MIKTLMSKIINRLGYRIEKRISFSGSYSPYSTVGLDCINVVDLERLATISTSIPGMISPQSGQLLYTMCYMQQLEGDVVEIGSWQGRSTSFLARAVENSKNGKFYAIDHFRGNVGKEAFYVVGEKDLSDLKGNFFSNMERIGLRESICLLEMTNEAAEQRIEDASIRFLFVDGDHTKSGVEKDIKLFFPKLKKGAIVVFDDFSPAFPGLIKAITELLAEQDISRIMSYRNTLVIEI